MTAPAGSASLRAAGQRGQVLVWFLAFAATLAVVFAGVYSVGQVTSEKRRHCGRQVPDAGRQRGVSAG